jgi:asparagine synthase (glutamine-hydrolysing)
VVYGLEVGLPALLRYEDRNSMEHSVEGRIPFVSEPLVQLALSLPDDYLVSPDGTIKCVLKAAMRGLVPDVVLDRSDRIGFDVPLHTWPSLIPDVADLLEAALDLPPVHAPAMRPLLGRVRRGETLSPGDALTVWRLVGLSDWASDFQVVFD